MMSSFNSTLSSNQSGIIVSFIAKITNIDNIETLSLIIRKLAHFTEYFILGLLVYNFISNYKFKLYYGVLICIIYSISDEIHQLYVPGRSCQLLDILIDISGALISILLLKLIIKKHK